MLKWLVTRGPSGPPLENPFMTDDPLATIRRNTRNKQPIYAVSRINPIFQEEVVESSDVTIVTVKDETKENLSKPKDIVTKELPESPVTDRESVQSSGYGSKEADSVSYKSDDEEDTELGEVCKVMHNEGSLHTKLNDNQILMLPSSGCVAELRKSFETMSNSTTVNFPNKPKVNISTEVDIVQQNKDFVKAIELGCHKTTMLEVIPEVTESAENSPSKSLWPHVEIVDKQTDRVHERRERGRLKDFEKQENDGDYRNNKNQILRFNPLVSVVVQDREYVTSISVSPKEKVNNLSATKYISNNSFNSNFMHDRPKLKIHLSDNEVPSVFKQNNSNVSNEFPLLSLQPDSLINEETIEMMNYPDWGGQRCVEYQNGSHYKVLPADMPDFGRALYAGIYSTQKGSSVSSHGSSVIRSNSNQSNCAKRKKGVSVVKDLWEKTGMKTNGRKLLVDVNDILETENKSSKCSLLSANQYHNVHADDNYYHRLSSSTSVSTSNRSSALYEDISRYPPHSLLGSYAEVIDREGGFDNPGFMDDKGQYNDGFTQSKSGFQFQYNLTDFQKRVNEKLQDEPSTRNSIGLNNHENCKNGPCSGVISRAMNKQQTNKNKKFPGKAVKEFGLDNSIGKRHENSDRFRTWTSQPYPKNQEILPERLNQVNRLQFWESVYNNSIEGASSSFFSPHPNSEAVICANGEQGPCQDFTLDARRSLRIQKKSYKRMKRRRCCSFILIVVAFCSFIGIIIGVSWFYTRGQRIFGPMK